MIAPRRLIAVVDDDPDCRIFLREVLRAYRYEVTEYESGQEALGGLRQAKPDLVLLDIRLPGLDGTQVIQALRTDPQLWDLPVIAMTGHTMARNHDRFLSAGFDSYVAKPILDEEDLLGAIERLLGQAPD